VQPVTSPARTVEERYDEAAGMPRFEEPNWTKVPVDRRQLRAMQRRSDLPGLARFGTYVGLLVAFAWLTVAADPLWLKAVFFLLYSTVFAFSEPILHETHHRTPFKSLWLNETVHYVAGLLAFREPIRDRWLHAGHHTYTYYSEIDPEIVTERPPRFWTFGLDLLRVHIVVTMMRDTLRMAFAGMDELGERWIPRDHQRQVVWSARACVAFYVAVIALAVAIGSWYPILFVFAARFVGAPLCSAISFVQHVGLEENVADWRENTRTVHMNPLIRLFYWNMNYHVEHHMYPTVPCQSLGALHREIAKDSPPPYRNTFEAWGEMMRALWRQRKDPTYSARRPVPEIGARDASDGDRSDANGRG
jgi:fatty acid desaturase